MTKQRDLVLRVLRESEGHMTAAQIYKNASEKMPGIAVGTVYRNLGILEQNHLISRFTMSDGTAIYDKTPTRHSHMICVKCRKITDIMDDSIISALEEKTSVKFLSVFMTAEYICDECAAKS